VATASLTAFPWTCLERDPQLFMHCHLDRNADVLVDQPGQKRRLTLLRSCRFFGTVAHGAFLRWPPARAADWSCTSSTGRMRHFSFPHHRGRHRGGDEGDALILFIPQSPLYRTKTRKSVTCVTVPEGRGGVGEVG